MRVVQTNEPIVLKGRYLVTDPCYVYGDDNWDKFCNLIFAAETEAVNHRSITTLFEIDGKQVPVMSTAYGDGSYPVYNPTTNMRVGSFGVDSSLFAFIPWTSELGMHSDLGPIIELEGVLTCNNGDAFINGKLVVDTSGNNEPVGGWEDDN